jgi:hypothetical protein
VIETEGDSRGAEVQVAVGMEVFGYLAMCVLWGLAAYAGQLVRRHKHNDDMLVLTVRLYTMCCCAIVGRLWSFFYSFLCLIWPLFSII